MLAAYPRRIRDELLLEFGQQQLSGFFANKKTQLGALVYLPTATSVVLNGLPVATCLNMMNVMSFADLDSAAMSLVRALNDQLQRSEALGP